METPFNERFEKRLDQGFRAEGLLPLIHFGPREFAAQCFRFASRSVSSCQNAGGRNAPMVLACLNQSHQGQCHCLGDTSSAIRFLLQVKTCQPCRAFTSAGFSSERWMLQLTSFLKLVWLGHPCSPVTPRSCECCFFPLIVIFKNYFYV